MLLTGCAGPLVGSGPGGAVPTELSGIWHGSFVQFGGTLYTDDANCVVEIREDGTFTATVMPAGGANNLAKPSKWAGTVVRNGNRITFRVPPGPWLTLVLRGDTLYGVANDPATEADVMIRLDRS